MFFRNNSVVSGVAALAALALAWEAAQFAGLDLEKSLKPPKQDPKVSQAQSVSGIVVSRSSPFADGPWR